MNSRANENHTSEKCVRSAFWMHFKCVLNGFFINAFNMFGVHLEYIIHSGHILSAFSMYLLPKWSLFALKVIYESPYEQKCYMMHKWIIYKCFVSVSGDASFFMYESHWNNFFLFVSKATHYIFGIECMKTRSCTAYIAVFFQCMLACGLLCLVWRLA